MRKYTRVTDCIAPAFFGAHNAIKRGDYTHYWFCGGRGSTKSSFCAIQTVLAVKRSPDVNAVVIRKVADTLRDSVFAQVLWAIEILGLTHEFRASVSPMEIKHVSGTRILFRGIDKPEKLKSLKFAQGYCGLVWYEELDQLAGMREVRNVNQSLIRGGDRFVILYSYNPPRHRGSWVNVEVNNARPDRLVHRSCYTEVPREWLGEAFIHEAEMLKERDEDSYRHEYLGEAVGVGGVVFSNVEIRRITDEEVEQFDHIYHGIDWGFDPDPFTYGKCHYERNTRTLYIFEEFNANRISNEKAAEEVKKRAAGALVLCDSAEPKSIADLRAMGIDARPVAKGKDSVARGVKWLASHVERIVIDPERAPLAAKEFPAYEHVRTKDGEYTSALPDKDNHAIDRTRYACQPLMQTQSAPSAW